MTERKRRNTKERQRQARAMAKFVAELNGDWFTVATLDNYQSAQSMKRRINEGRGAYAPAGAYEARVRDDRPLGYAVEAAYTVVNTPVVQPNDYASHDALKRASQELAASPGYWIKVRAYASYSSAYGCATRLRKGKAKGFKPGRYETDIRKNTASDTSWEVWARYRE